MAEFINTIDVLGDEVVMDSIIDRTITEFKDDKITNIGSHAFCDCTALKTVLLPNLVTMTGGSGYHNFFKNCTALEEVDMPSLKTITGAAAFDGCNSLSTVNMPVLETAGSQAFRSTRIVKAVFPKLKDLGNAVFSGTPLEILDLHSITSISGPFEYCNKFKALIIRTPEVCNWKINWGMPPTIMSTKTGYIYVPSALVESYKAATNWSTYASQFRGIFDDEDVLQGIANGTLVNLQSNKITSIPKYGCYNYTALKSVSSDSATEVGKFAFHGCTALETVDLPNVTTADYAAFQGCIALQNVTLPNLETASSDFFRECCALETLNLPKIKAIPENFIYGTAVAPNTLKSVSTPVATTIGAYAFRKCAALESITFPAVTNINGAAFDGCTSLTAFVISNESVVATLSNANAFTATPIASGTGYFYVPRALVDSYKAATNWSTYATQFRALEDYTVDGTVTGEIDPYKPWRESDIVSDSLVFNLELRGRTAENNPNNPPTITDTVSGLACTTYNIDWDGIDSGFVEDGLLLKNCNLIDSKNLYSETTYSVLGTPKLPDVDFSDGITWECWTNTDGGVLCRFFKGTSNGKTLYLEVEPGKYGYAQTFVDSEGTNNIGAYYDFEQPYYTSTNVETGAHLFSYTYSPDGILSHYVDGRFLGSTDYNSKGTFGYFCLPEVIKTMEANYIGSLNGTATNRRMVISEYRMYNRVLSADEVMNNYAVTKISQNGG